MTHVKYEPNQISEVGDNIIEDLKVSEEIVREYLYI